MGFIGEKKGVGPSFFIFFYRKLKSLSSVEKRGRAFWHYQIQWRVGGNSLWLLGFMLCFYSSNLPGIFQSKTHVSQMPVILIFLCFKWILLGSQKNKRGVIFFTGDLVVDYAMPHCFLKYSGFLFCGGGRELVFEHFIVIIFKA